ncbi:MAG: ABC transporter ATP-binding protein [Propionibacteriaceae bacterium]
MTETSEGTGDVLLDVHEVTVRYTVGVGRAKRQLVAVDQADLTVEVGQIRALVGESGSGKSTLARVVCGLERDYTGTVSYDGQPLTYRRTRDQRRQVQMVFQDPYASLDPRMTVAQTLSELLRYHRIVPRAQVRDRCRELLERVHLPASLLDQRPAGMSGGQRQRVAIARALALDPRLLVADEAVSALDVSVQAGIVNLLADLRDDLGVAVLFIAHDLAVVRTLCDEVSVIHHGRIVEEGSRDALFDDPQDPYTRQLLAAVPRLQSAHLDRTA